MQIPSTDGVTLALHDFGGDGDPLLIAHATGFCGGAYRPLAAALSRRFHVWAVDFRGHGDSTVPDDEDFAWTGMGDDALAAISAVQEGAGAGARRVVAFGHSMGGAAVLMAELSQRGLLGHVFLFEPIVPGDTEQRGDRDNPLAVAARRRRSSFPSAAAALERYASRPPLSELRADALAAYVQHGFRASADGTVELKCAPEHEARTFEADAKLTVDRVAGLRLPATVAVGGRTEPTGPAVLAPALVRALLDAELVTYDHLGHFGPLQDPETLADDVATTCLPFDRLNP